MLDAVSVWMGDRQGTPRSVVLKLHYINESGLDAVPLFLNLLIYQ
jgi:hypothetical protein